MSELPDYIQSNGYIFIDTRISIGDRVVVDKGKATETIGPRAVHLGRIFAVVQANNGEVWEVMRNRLTFCDKALYEAEHVPHLSVERSTDRILLT